ncbi:MAG: hypothetical protein HY581_12205 [Nitrospirae bacterium]|nr:hypothetical protein [Nitrospirota bacterium]
MNRCLVLLREIGRVVMFGVLLAVAPGLPAPVGDTLARELMAPKEQAITEFEQTMTPSFDDQKRGVPQSFFVWIKMAKGYEVEWDSFGRKGWYTQDPRIKPIEPGTTVFSPETEAVYIVFEITAQEDPLQLSAQWYLTDETSNILEPAVGRDALAAPAHERYGFLELKKPADGWKKGAYLVKVYVTPEGQQPFHAANQVGTMRFKITDQPSAPGTSEQK